MDEPPDELTLDTLPRPPLFKLVNEEGRDVFAEARVTGGPATVGVIFSDEASAREFSENAGEHGMAALAGLAPAELRDWGSVEIFAAAGEDYVLVISDPNSAGLFHANDLASRAAEEAKGLPLEGLPFPLYLLSDARGEAPLITVETGEAGAEEVLVAALFSSPEKARAFRKRAAHLDLPHGLGTIEDAEGLRRHALVARQAGAGYAVVDPGPGESDAVPIEDLIH